MSRFTAANHNAQEIGENNKHREGSTCRLVATSMVKEPSTRRGFGHHRHIWRSIDFAKPGSEQPNPISNLIVPVL